MCGFVGGTDLGWNLAAAVAALRHRGPDASALHRADALGLGFCRLKIVDLDDTANQPMTSADGSSPRGSVSFSPWSTSTRPLGG